MSAAYLGYVVVYDAVEAGIEGSAMGVTLGQVGTVVGAVAMVAALAVGLLKKNARPLFLAVLGSSLFGFSGLLWFGYNNVVNKQQQCIDWLESGDYELAQGRVTGFEQKPTSGAGEESFTVDGVRFSYSDHDLSKGGFHQSQAYGGPMAEGQLVRIAHHDGRILRIEIWDSSVAPGTGS